MFYLVNTKGSFLVGYVPAGERTVLMFEGQVIQGIPKITKRLEKAARSTDDAWEFLCETVMEARADGYLDKHVDTSHLQVPPDLHQDKFPLALRGVYARVKSCSYDQFAAGLARLLAVHEAVSDAGVEVKIGTEGKSVELSVRGAHIRFGFVPDGLWGTMATKGKELCEERGMMGDNFLLPDGRGMLHLLHRETILDLYVRAFLDGSVKAGAVIELTSDHSWKFVAGNPFLTADVRDLQWYQGTPALHGRALKLDQMIPVSTAQAADALDFYC